MKGHCTKFEENCLIKPYVHPKGMGCCGVVVESIPPKKFQECSPPPNF